MSRNDNRTDVDINGLTLWDRGTARNPSPSWFVPAAGFQFVNRDALVVVLGYDGGNALRGAMECGGQWAFVNLSDWGDEWAHSAPLGSPRCKACRRVDCPTVGGCNKGCGPITWSKP